MKLNSITKKFGTFTALDGVSAEFHPGKIYVFAGPNGAGKTTLLRVIAGLLRPTSGEVIFTPSPHPSPTRGEGETIFPSLLMGEGEGGGGGILGVMMQESYLYRDLTPRENLELYAGLYGVSPERVAVVKGLLDLEHFFEHDVGTLSHGQRQRVSLARALLSDPKVILLDEPFLGLDAASIGHVQKFLDSFKNSGGLALIATHELELVREVADELLLLEDGRVKYLGTFNI